MILSFHPLSYPMTMLLKTGFLFIILWSSSLRAQKIQYVEEKTSLYKVRTQRDYAELISLWGQSVQKFRVEHNLNITVGWIGGNWEYVANDQPRNVDVTEFELFFRYAYHIPIVSKFGYFLGVQAGLSQLLNSSPEISYGMRYHYPGLYSGLVYNFDPALRLSVGVDLMLGRIDKIKFYDFSNQPLGVTTQSLQYSIGLDIFTELKSGFRIEYVWQRLWPSIPEKGKDSFLAEIKKAQTSRILRLGYTYHIL